MSSSEPPKSGLAEVDIFTLARDIVDKLRLLNYELTFCPQTGHGPVTHHFFCVQGKVDEVYPYFVSLCNWLFETAKVSLSAMGLEPLSEFGDMTQVPLSIINGCINLGLVEDEKVLSVSKLRGCHPETIGVIVDFLATCALNSNNFELSEAAYTAAAAAHEAHVDMAAVMGEDDFDRAFANNTVSKNTTNANYTPNVSNNTTTTKTAASNHLFNTDPSAHEQWKLKYEELLPRLNFKSTTALREWRNHFQQTSQCKTAVSQDLPETTSMLARLAKDLKQKTDKIAMKENQLNTQLGNESNGIGSAIQKSKTKLNTLEAESLELNEKIGVMTEENKNVNAKLQKLRNDIESKNAAMTDTTPLTTLQDTIAQLKRENSQLEIKVGILNYMYLQGQQQQQLQKQRAEAVSKLANNTKNRNSALDLTLNRKKEVRL